MLKGVNKYYIKNHKKGANLFFIQKSYLSNFINKRGENIPFRNK